MMKVGGHYDRAKGCAYASPVADGKGGGNACVEHGLRLNRGALSLRCRHFP
jgi:hypothetical protein